MPERRSTLAEVAERMRVTPRWLREKVNAMPTPIGHRFGRLWTFTAAQEHDLIEHLHREQCPPIPVGRQPRRSWEPSPSADEMYAEAMRLATEKRPKKLRPKR